METNNERQNLPLQEDAAKSTVLRKVKMLMDGWLLSHEDTGIGLYRLREFWSQAYSEVLNEATLMFWDRLHRTV